MLLGKINFADIEIRERRIQVIFWRLDIDCPNFETSFTLPAIPLEPNKRMFLKGNIINDSDGGPGRQFLVSISSSRRFSWFIQNTTLKRAKPLPVAFSRVTCSFS